MALELTIVTPEGCSYEGPVEAIVLPGSEGEFGVFEGHERLLTALKAGPVEIRGGEAGGSEWAAVTQGFVEVTGESVVVMVDHCVLADAIDAAEAERERASADEELRALSGAEENDERREELERALAVAEARIEVAAHARA
jgi:F-type H+-transporting ATPase subunit epsilon